jgi:hypothetical protein
MEEQKMKKQLLAAVLAVGLMVGGMVGTASATSVSFNFENSGSNYNDASLLNYLKTTSGLTNVSTSGTTWYENSVLFGSDVLYVNASNGSGTIDFDTLARSASTYKINSLQFTWGVFQKSSSIDFGLDVFNDATDSWSNNYYTVNNVDYSTGASGLLTFASAMEVTAIRVHDGGSMDVGIDNLVINDNRGTAPVPEPGTMMLLGIGLGGLAIFGKRRMNKEA